LIVLFFGLEETAFQRDRYVNRSGDRHLVDSAEPLALPEKTLEHASAVHPSDLEKAPTREDAMPTGTVRTRMSFSYSRPKTYLDRIRIITLAPNLQGIGLKQYFHRLWHTLRVFSFPAVWFAGLQWGLQNVCLTFYLTEQEDGWYGEPWNYTATEVGNMNLPTLIGSLVGCAFGGYGSDLFMQWMIKRNKGVMEAEFRLYLMAVCTIVFPVGMWLFGIGSARGWDWPVPYVGLGFIGFGYGCAGDLSLAYLADSFPYALLSPYTVDMSIC
jgi:hypothetical protein